MKFGIDTNILVYASGYDDVSRHRQCAELLDSLKPHSIFLSLQVIAEFHRVISRKTLNKALASELVADLASTYGVAGMDARILPAALEPASKHQFQIFDALILAQCADGDCELLLSEDMHDGLRWKGCTVVNPLAVIVSPLLTAALGRNEI